MRCAACGKEREPGRFRCPECQHITPAFWPNLFAFVLLTCAVVVNVFYTKVLLSIFVDDLAAAGLEASLALRLYLAFSRLFGVYWWVFVGLALVTVFMVRRRSGWFSRFVKSGAALSCVAFAAVLFTLGGLLDGLTEHIVTHDSIEDTYTIRRYFDVMIVLNYINLFEKDFHEHNPGVYSCNLSDMTSAAGSKLFFSGDSSRPRLGYVYTISGCEESKRERYRIVALPEKPSRATYAFCTNESRVVRWGAYSDKDPKTLEKVLAGCP